MTEIGPRGPSRLRFGVPPGGPWDEEAADLARALVGATHCLELLMRARVTLEADSDASLSVVGGLAQVTIDGRTEAGNRCRRVRKGSLVRVETLSLGATYVAWGAPRREGVLEFDLASRREEPVSVLSAGQRSDFAVPSEASVALGDRVGLRLSGWTSPHDVELPSEPSCFGAVQVTPSGSLLVSGPDGPTLGGYPKAWVVTRSSRGRLIQSGGEPFAFREVTLAEAQAEFERHDREHRRRLAILALG